MIGKLLWEQVLSGGAVKTGAKFGARNNDFLGEFPVGSRWKLPYQIQINTINITFGSKCLDLKILNSKSKIRNIRVPKV